ncbi:hypothetical protein Avbf_09983 [Armadillidium vulgare]|nr:hypothetical protein Avbf_09983 [Armadillidium vulgare]
MMMIFISICISTNCKQVLTLGSGQDLQVKR